MTGKNFTRTALAALAALIMAAAPLRADQKLGGDSPQDVVARLQRASKSGSMAEMAAVVAPQDRKEMAVALLAGSAMIAAFTRMGAEMGGSVAEGAAGENPTAEEKAKAEAQKKKALAEAQKVDDRLRAILKKHKMEKFLDTKPSAAEDGGSAEARIEALLKGVDEIALIDDLDHFMSEMNTSKDSGSPGAPTGGIKQLPPVSDYKITGDTATAKAGTDTLDFAKVDGRWYFVPPKQEAEPPAPQKP